LAQFGEKHDQQICKTADDVSVDEILGKQPNGKIKTRQDAHGTNITMNFCPATKTFCHRSL